MGAIISINQSWQGLPNLKKTKRKVETTNQLASHQVIDWNPGIDEQVVFYFQK